MNFVKPFLNFITDSQSRLSNTNLLKDSSATRHMKSCILWRLSYKFKRVVGKTKFRDQLKKISNVIKEWDKTRISCNSLQSQFIAMVSSLIARQWVTPQTH